MSLASLIFSAASIAPAQTAGTPSAAVPAATRAAYLQRGDEVERRYKVHRERLEHFFARLGECLRRESPELLDKKLAPPSAVPFGYQVLPRLLTDPPSPARRARIILSPFSWPRTDSIIDRGRERLLMLERRLDRTARLTPDERRRQYEAIVDEYRKLVDGQKFMANLIQYNRLWQSEIARLPASYAKNNALRDAALARQALVDSISRGDEQLRRSAQPRIAALSAQIDSALQKSPTPQFVRVERPEDRIWIVSVPVYTDIADSAFVDAARDAIENAWRVRNVEDDFRVKLDIRRIPPSQLYANGVVPTHGQQIDVTAHLKRFPQDGVVLTTGANTTYVFGQSMILGPHDIPRQLLVHEFGHMLGFRDGYFRSYEDRGTNGYEVLEVILDPDGLVTAPENGRVKRQHFEQILKEKLR